MYSTWNTDPSRVLTNFATNFEKARGFVRTQWKSKNFNPNDDPTAVDSSTDDSELA